MTGAAGGGHGNRRPVVVDLTPLRLDPGFRSLWLGQLGSAVGRESGRFVFPIHLYVLTGSVALLGVVAALQLAATIIMSLSGGWLSDRFDRRVVILGSSSVMLISSVGLLVLATAETPVLPLIVAFGVTATSMFTLEQPARGSSLPRLVPAERLPAAVALNSLTFQTMGVVGPAVAALMLGVTGLVGAYAVQVVGYAWALFASSRMPPMPATGTAEGTPWSMLLASLSFVKARRVIQACFAVDLIAMIFALPQGSLLPVLLIEVYGASPTMVGLLMAARAAGAVLTAVFSGWTRTIASLGAALLGSVLLYAIITIAIGLLKVEIWLAIPLLAIAGGTDVISVICRAVIIQTATPDELRGRVTALHVLASAGGPRIGDIRAAAMAATLGASGSLVAGGVIAVIGILGVARKVPELRAYRLPRG